MPAAPAPPPVAELRQILTTQQQQEYNQAIDRSMDRAQRNLAALGGRRLNPEQTLAVERITTFIQQALEARKTDLLRAKSLAQRTDVLAEDLLQSIQQPCAAFGTGNLVQSPRRIAGIDYDPWDMSADRGAGLCLSISAVQQTPAAPRAYSPMARRFSGGVPRGTSQPAPRM